MKFCRRNRIYSKCGCLRTQALTYGPSSEAASGSALLPGCGKRELVRGPMTGRPRQVAPLVHGLGAAYSTGHKGRGSCVSRRRGVLRVLLTGATGLIGSAVLARLLAEGH